MQIQLTNQMIIAHQYAVMVNNKMRNLIDTKEAAQAWIDTNNIQDAEIKKIRLNSIRQGF